MSPELGDRLSFLGDRLRRDVPVGPLTTYRVGGPARWFLEVVDGDELAAVAAALAGTAPEVLVVGRGSNLLVTDAGFDGLVHHLDELHDGGVAVTTARTPDSGRRTARRSGS